MTSGIVPPMGSIAGEAARAGLVAAAFTLVFTTAEIWRRRLAPPVEWTRKEVHLGNGLVCVSLPWLFRWHWTVLVLGALFAAAMWVGRKLRLLDTLMAVERDSKGELYFPIAVYVLFVIARHQPVFYLISLGTLVFSDALAAMVGTVYGRHQYPVEAERKSLEGSAVFLLTTFLIVQLPLLLMTNLDRGTCVIIAVQLALLVTSFEAVSMHGNDNLVVPLATYYLLLKLSPRPASATAHQLMVQLGILAATLLLARRTRFLTFSGAIAAHLMLYAAFSLGGPAWVVAPALALAGFIVLDAQQSRVAHLPRGGYQVAVIFYVSIVSVLLIFADNTFATLVRRPAGLGSGHPFHAPFVGALAAPLAIIAYQVFASMPRVRRRPALSRALAAGGLGFLVVAPLSLWALNGAVTAESLAVAALVTALGLALHLGARRLIGGPAGTLRDLRLQALSVLVATLASLPPHFAWIGVSDWSVPR